MLFLFGNAFLQLIYIMKYIIRVDADIGEIDEKKISKQHTQCTLCKSWDSHLRMSAFVWTWMDGRMDTAELS